MQQFTQNNPEFEFSRQVLMRERRHERVQGWVLTALGGVGTVFIVGLLITSLKQVLSLGTLAVIVYLAMMISFIATLAVGLSSLRQASKLPTDQQLAYARRAQRSRLMQHAQGKLPWSFQRSGQITLACVGSILIGMAAIILYTFGLPSWDAWLEGVCGLAVILYVVVVVPYERRRLPRESAELLAHALIAGEVTEGLPVEQHEQ